MHERQQDAMTYVYWEIWAPRSVHNYRNKSELVRY